MGTAHPAPAADGCPLYVARFVFRGGSLSVPEPGRTADFCATHGLGHSCRKRLLFALAASTGGVPAATLRVDGRNLQSPPRVRSAAQSIPFTPHYADNYSGEPLRAAQPGQDALRPPDLVRVSGHFHLANLAT